MSESTHIISADLTKASPTPAPWFTSGLEPTHWECDTVLVKNSFGVNEVIAIVSGGDMGSTHSDQLPAQANARLIAAAPTMLAALKACADANQCLINIDPDSTLGKVRAAIAAAKGEEDQDARA